jgi:hypothetical protein
VLDLAAIRGSSVPIKVLVSGVNLTTATEITMVFAWQSGTSPLTPLTKTKSGGQITVTYDAPTTTSALSLTLSDADTATITQQIFYTLYINDGTAGGDWVPDNGGNGVIQFIDSVHKT